MVRKQFRVFESLHICGCDENVTVELFKNLEFLFFLIRYIIAKKKW